MSVYGYDADYVAPPSRTPWAPPRFTGQPRTAVITPMLANILESLSEGKSNKAIGFDWGISEDTVKTHMRRLYARTGARDRCHLLSMLLNGALTVQIDRARGGRS